MASSGQLGPIMALGHIFFPDNIIGAHLFCFGPEAAWVPKGTSLQRDPFFPAYGLVWPQDWDCQCLGRLLWGWGRGLLEIGVLAFG